MRKNKETFPKYSDLELEVMAMSKSNEPSPIEIELKEKYPGVPYPLSEVWERSDYDVPRNLEREEMVNNTAKALMVAADICPSIQSTNAPTSLEAYLNYTNALKEAVFRTEALLDELQFKYPLPTKERSRYTRAEKNLQAHLPQILLNSEDCVIIWMPNMPAIGHSVNNLLFAELKDLLLSHDFPPVKKWHCDFIHVFPEEMLGCRDVDNYPYKPVIDALTLAFFTRDGSDYFSCSMYNHFTKSIKQGCYIVVTKRDEKVGFFADFEERISRL